MAKIFLSYHRSSQAVAEGLVQDLEAMGHDVWCDQELAGGQVWWNRILVMIRDCEVFVLVLDAHSLDSIACKREYGYAADLGKSVLPVLTADGVSINLLPPALSQVQLVDIRSGDRAAVLRLARALTTLPPPAALPDPLPASPAVPLSYLGTLTEQVEKSSSLTYEEQSALIVDLRANARDGDTRSDALTLLKRLRKRRDLFASIADEIDEVLRAERRQPVPPVEPARPVAGVPSEVGPPLPRAAPAPRPGQVGIGAGARLQMGAIGFAVGATVVGVAVGLAGSAGTQRDWVLISLGCGGLPWSLAGVIAAKRGVAVKSALAFATVALLMGWMVTTGQREPEAFLVAMVFGGSGGIVLGAIVGVILARRKKASDLPAVDPTKA
jgi:TIR domain